MAQTLTWILFKIYKLLDKKWVSWNKGLKPMHIKVKYILLEEVYLLAKPDAQSSILVSFWAPPLPGFFPFFLLPVDFCAISAFFTGGSFSSKPNKKDPNFFLNCYNKNMFYVGGIAVPWDIFTRHYLI